MIEIALTDLGADINCTQERLIPLKHYEKVFERLIQANREKLIINFKDLLFIYAMMEYILRQSFN